MIEYEKIEEEKQKLEKHLKIAQSKVATLPEGKLICERNGKNYKWFLQKNGKCTYLPKKERKLAEQLAYRRYLEAEISDLNLQIQACQCFLAKMKSAGNLKTERLLRNEEYGKLLQNSFKPIKRELKEWSEEPYEGNPQHAENLICRSATGKMVRSKSEAIIDTLLFQNRIPFRYEAPLQLDGRMIYPDFTIRHPVTGEFYYWEHFGMMDVVNYRNGAFERQRLYCANGIYPSINLILTYETREKPMNVENAEQIIHQYFLHP